MVTLLVANGIIGLDPQLSWAHMVMASISLTGALLLWQGVLLRAKQENADLRAADEGEPGLQRKFSWKRSYWLAALGIPLFLSGLFPWGAAHWHNLTFFVVVGCGSLATFWMWIVHRKVGPDFRIPKGPFFLCGTLTAFFFVGWSVALQLVLPHVISNSPAVTLSGRAPGGEYRLRAIPGKDPFGDPKWTVVVEDRDSAGNWHHFYPPGPSSRKPRHLSGSFIEGQWESSLRASWTGRNTFEISYFHANGGGIKKRLHRYVFTIDEAKIESGAGEPVQCEHSVEDSRLANLLGGKIEIQL